MYGTSNQAAVFDIFPKEIIVARIASHKTTISMNAPPGDCRPKKIIDQNVLRTSCTINIPSATRTSFRSNPLFQMRKAAIPMRAKRVTHTGPNSQLGGAKLGFTIPAYQVGIDDEVKTEPIIPASCDTAIAMMSLIVLFMDFV